MREFEIVSGHVFSNGNGKIRKVVDVKPEDGIVHYESNHIIGYISIRAFVRWAQSDITKVLSQK